jgi:hypothetical protein
MTFWKIVKAVTLVVPAIEGIVRAVKAVFDKDDPTLPGSRRYAN